MGYKRSRAGFPLLSVIAAAGLSLVLAGCSSDRYFMVPKKDLTEMNSSVNSQRATLVTMEGNASIRHEQLLQQEELTTRTILEAIEKKVKKPACPPPPTQPACPTPEDTGRADRLKGKVIVGEVEKLYLAEPGLVYTARIDSGAETSSLDARNITRFERDGNNWVRFDVPVPDTDELVTLEKEVSRRVRIIQASTEDSERRVVVELQFAIGDHKQVAEFTLADRSNLTYEVLIGRNVLRDVMLIDVGKEFATELPKDLKRNGDDA